MKSLEADFFKDVKELLQQYGIELKLGRGYFKGGSCRYNNRKILYLNRTEKLENQIEIILSEVEYFNVKRDKIKPEIESILQRNLQN